MDIQEQLDQLWDFDHPAQSEQRFLAYLTTADHPDIKTQMLSQLARSQGLQGKFDQAYATLDQAEQLQPLSAPGQIRAALERGRLLNSSGKPEQARPFFRRAWELGRQHALDFLAIDAAHMLAIVGDLQEQLKWNHQALELCDQTPNLRAKQWRASLYNNLGWTYHAQGAYDTALEMFQKALAERELQGKAGAIRIAKWCVARCLRSLGQTQEALRLQQALHAELEAASQKDGYVYEEIGECLRAMGQEVEAQSWFALAEAELNRDA